jgi:hypothetical protein
VRGVVLKPGFYKHLAPLEPGSSWLQPGLDL